MRIGTLKRLASALVGLLIAGGFYMLLIDTSSQPELWAGLGAWILAAIAYEISREQGLVEARIRLTWLLRSWRVAIRVPVHVALVSRDAVAQLLAPRSRRGRFRAVPFGAGGDEPVDAGRRALAEALGSLTPNTIVIGIDTESKLLLVHQLHPQGGREELDPLGLG
jgi:multisubunit Na+/H+ antiporter MnhE subunit